MYVMPLHYAKVYKIKQAEGTGEVAKEHYIT